MVDDKDGSTPDPWAGIDDEGAGQSADGFTFSFDALGEAENNPLPEPGDESAPAPPAITPDADDAPIIRIDAATAAPADVDPFADVSIDAAGAADVSAWLDEPDAGAEPPLTVFPTAAADAPEHPATPTDFLTDLPALDALGSDDVHEGLDAAGAVAGSSHVEVGTGLSGVVSPSQVDPPSDGGAMDDWAEAAAGEGAFDPFSTDDQTSFDASGFDGVSESNAAAPGEPQFDVGVAEVAGAGAAATMAQPARHRQADGPKGGGIGQLIGIVLGGVMAIPITYAILIWGFQKDPFKLAKLVPAEVAFLLPQKFQPGSKQSGGPKLEAASALDTLPAVAEGEPVEPEPGTEPAPVAEEPQPMKDLPAADLAAAPETSAQADASPTEPREPAPESPVPPPFDELVAEPKTPPAGPVAPPEPEPLDVAALEAAVGEATAAFDSLAAADPEAPDRKKLLVNWYKRLAAVAEQIVLLEKVALDSGRSLDGTLGGVEGVRAAIATDATVQADLARLGAMWLASKKRPSDGAVLLGTFAGARQVGPYWSSRVEIAGAEPRTVAVISRAEPKGEPGEQVLVTGVLFDGDVIWASDCRPLAGKAAPVEDLF